VVIHSPSISLWFKRILALIDFAPVPLAASHHLAIPELIIDS
jgi:hypothetical protein